MQSLETTRELDSAIKSIEKLLNSKDGELVLEAIKQYKENKILDQNTILKIQQCLSI